MPNIHVQVQERECKTVKLSLFCSRPDARYCWSQTGCRGSGSRAETGVSFFTTPDFCLPAFAEDFIDSLLCFLMLFTLRPHSCLTTHVCSVSVVVW